MARLASMPDTGRALLDMGGGGPLVVVVRKGEDALQEHVHAPAPDEGQMSERIVEPKLRRTRLGRGLGNAFDAGLKADDVVHDGHNGDTRRRKFTGDKR